MAIRWAKGPHHGTAFPYEVPGPGIFEEADWDRMVEQGLLIPCDPPKPTRSRANKTEE